MCIPSILLYSTLILGPYNSPPIYSVYIHIYGPRVHTSYIHIKTLLRTSSKEGKIFEPGLKRGAWPKGAGPKSGVGGGEKRAREAGEQRSDDLVKAWDRYRGDWCCPHSGQRREHALLPVLWCPSPSIWKVSHTLGNSLDKLRFFRASLTTCWEGWGGKRAVNGWWKRVKADRSYACDSWQALRQHGPPNSPTLCNTDQQLPTNLSLIVHQSFLAPMHLLCTLKSMVYGETGSSVLLNETTLSFLSIHQDFWPWARRLGLRVKWTGAGVRNRKLISPSFLCTVVEYGGRSC